MRRYGIVLKVSSARTATARHACRPPAPTLQPLLGGVVLLRASSPPSPLRARGRAPEVCKCKQSANMVGHGPALQGARASFTGGGGTGTAAPLSSAPAGGCGAACRRDARPSCWAARRRRTARSALPATWSSRCLYPVIERALELRSLPSVGILRPACDHLGMGGSASGRDLGSPGTSLADYRRPGGECRLFSRHILSAGDTVCHIWSICVRMIPHLPGELAPRRDRLPMGSKPHPES
eukprot:gene1367-biopygen12313